VRLALWAKKDLSGTSAIGGGHSEYRPSTAWGVLKRDNPHCGGQRLALADRYILASEAPFRA
jgi:hypothetical protein